jgi:hypothetical protein
MNQENTQELKSAWQQQLNPIGSDGYSVFLPEDVRANLSAYRNGDLLAGNTLFQNLYQKDQNAALSMIDKGGMTHNSLLGAMNTMYGIDENGMKNDASPYEMLAMMKNKKPKDNTNNQTAQQQGAAPARPNNMPGNQTNSALSILHRR